MTRRLVSVTTIVAFGSLCAASAVAEPGGWQYVLEWDRIGSANDIAVDSQGEVYVADGTNGRVIVFSATGDSLREKSGFTRPSGIAIDANDVIYVLGECRIYRYTRAFEPLGSWDTCLGQGDLMHALALDVRGELVGVGTVSTLLTFTTDGTLLREFPHYTGWRGVSIASDGTIWVVAEAGIVRHYSADAQVLAQWQTILPDEQGSHPRGLAADSSGRLFTCDDRGRLKIFYPNGQLADMAQIQLRFLTALELDDDDILYVGTAFPERIMKFHYKPVTVEAASWGNIKARFR